MGPNAAGRKLRAMASSGVAGAADQSVGNEKIPRNKSSNVGPDCDAQDEGAAPARQPAVFASDASLYAFRACVGQPHGNVPRRLSPRRDGTDLGIGLAGLL